MDSYISYFLLVFMSFFTLINPFGSMPVFLSMSSDLQPKQRNRTARKAVIVAFFTLLLFAFAGNYIFQIFGISVNSLKVVGGIIFLMVGHDMLEARIGRTKISDSEKQVNAYVNDISITPLAIPMICGPGAITNAILLMQDAETTVKKGVLVLAIAAIMMLTYFIYYGGTKILHRIGDTGTKVMMRIMGLIVMVIAVEFLFGGLKPILVDIIQSATNPQ
ncbi:multiple antibiotic resistance protein [Balneicella halophila]|uniref:UPF0056 membrane protein n=1 Tax=Balneicella halophila TaxID=1537566 RepID=A0A7L4UQ04_BALHA|nr:NAAT family transporter [Balneicella halophila]PVX51858.1 multiple antibiotic resistance protein [Balneicella halophila]